MSDWTRCGSPITCCKPIRPTPRTPRCWRHTRPSVSWPRAPNGSDSARWSAQQHFRPPALLVKAVTTLDVLSNGRMWFGVGAGYLDEEAQAMDLPLPGVAERFEHLED